MNPLQITFRGMDPSEALSEHLKENYSRLTTFEPHITSAHAIVEQAHRHHAKGRHFQVHLTLHVRGKDIAVTHDPGDKDSRENAYAAADEVFETAERMLKEHADRKESKYR